MEQRKVRVWGLCLIVVAAFLAAGHFVSRSLDKSQHVGQLSDLADVASRRIESAVSYSVATLDALADQTSGTIGCSSSTLQRARLSVYRRGAIKDIRIVRPDLTILCSAFNETLEFDRGWIGESDLVGFADGWSLFRVEQFFGTALGVIRPAEHGQDGLVAIVGIDGALFDVMPQSLLGHGRLELRLSSGASLFGAGALAESDAKLHVTREVAGLPVTVHIASDGAGVRSASGTQIPVMSIALLLGVAFGALLARIAFRPPNALDEIDRALRDGEFRPYFQPIVHLADGRVSHAEILARWVKTDGSVVPPVRFIDLMEANGRIPALTWLLLEDALKQFGPRLRKPDGLRLSLNVAPGHLIQPDFVDQLVAITRKANVSPECLTLEITEREPVEDLDHVNTVISSLHRQGFSIAIDDVGMGHSGLSQIQSLQADMLKIDKFFIDTVTASASTMILIEMLVRFADERGMKLVAEGIEDAGQAAALEAAGVHYGQGYHFARPLDAKAFDAYLNTSESALIASGPADREARRPDGLRCAG